MAELPRYHSKKRAKMTVSELQDCYQQKTIINPPYLWAIWDMANDYLLFCCPDKYPQLTAVLQKSHYTHVLMDVGTVFIFILIMKHLLGQALLPQNTSGLTDVCE